MQNIPSGPPGPPGYRPYRVVPPPSVVRSVVQSTRDPRRVEDHSRARYQLLLIIPIMAPLLTPLFNRTNPVVWGLPFFYWYQIACCLLALVITSLVYRLTRQRGSRRG